MRANSERLIYLYAEMSKLTAPECAHTCRAPFSCCAPLYCEQTMEWAKKHWDVTLEPVNGVNVRGETLPLLGPNGCIAAPHLRPICTVHTCQINSIGCKPGDLAWTKRYFELREELEELEFEDSGVL